MIRSPVLVGAFLAGVVLMACVSGCTAACPPSHAGATHATPATPATHATPATPNANPPSSALAEASAASPMLDDMNKASATLDRFHVAASAADEAAYFALFADGGVFLGTDAKERWTVPEFRAYAHPRFAAGKAWSFRASRRNVDVRGQTAWFDEDLETEKLGPARGSGVLVRDASGAWKVAQYNLSIPIPNERFAEVRKTIAAPGKP